MLNFKISVLALAALSLNAGRFGRFIRRDSASWKYAALTQDPDESSIRIDSNQETSPPAQSQICNIDHFLQARRCCNSNDPNHFLCRMSRDEQYQRLQICFDTKKECRQCSKPLISQGDVRNWLGRAISTGKQNCISTFLDHIMMRFPVDINGPVTNVEEIRIHLKRDSYPPKPAQRLHPDDIKGASLLILACAAGERDIVKKLIAAGADPTFVCESGVTPLSVAAALGYNDIVSTLLESGLTIEDGLMGAFKAAQEEGDTVALDRLQLVKKACEQLASRSES